jgi:hypothetical protein
MSKDSFTFAAGASTRSRSSSAACAAVAAVGIISGALVTLQLSSPPAASAPTVAAAPIVQITPTAKTWDLEPRWWGGDERRVEQVAPAAPATTPSAMPARTAAADVPAVAESDLTFAKGYALRLAARQATGQVAAIAPSTEGKTGAARPTVVARNTTAPARIVAAPTTRALAPPLSLAPSVEPAPANAGGQTLAFDEPRGFGAPHGGLFPNLFGTLH